MKEVKSKVIDDEICFKEKQAGISDLPRLKVKEETIEYHIMNALI